MSFWDKTVNNQPAIIHNPTTDEVVLDERAVAEIQDPNTNVFDDEQEDLEELMSDANLRLEQGRLYQMVLQNDIFADTNADPKAIRNVQREIRKHARERLEVLLGIRQEVIPETVAVRSDFNDTEVTVLKMLASKVSQGATEREPQKNGPQPAPNPPKKDGITAISGNLRPQTTPLSKSAKTPLKPQPKPQKQATKSALNTNEDGILTKPIEEMTPEELAAHDSQAIERRRKNYAAMPSNLVPHPTPQQLEMQYSIQASQVMAPGSAVSTVMALMNKNSK